MNPAWRISTGRLILNPVGAADMTDLVALKGDPLVYGQMLGGVRSPAHVAHELARETEAWSRHGVGFWVVRPVDGTPPIGLVGIEDRPDGRGMALRFAFTPKSRGRGLAREAAAAALRFAHERANLPRVIAVARETNIASRTVLGAIGMREACTFMRGTETMLVFESRVGSREPPAADPGRAY